MPPFDAEQYISRRMNRKMIPDLKPTGEPYSVKVGCTVRRGVVGKGAPSHGVRNSAQRAGEESHQ